MARGANTIGGKALSANSSWSEVLSEVLLKPAHQNLYVPKENLPHPRSIGISKVRGIPRGQMAEYRVPHDRGRSIHIREYRNYYAIHWDKHEPKFGFGLIQHLRCDTHYWWIILSGLTGYTMSGNRLSGAFCGALIGALTRG